MHPAFVYLPGDRLTLPELSSARLDGHVVELGEGYIPADLVEGPALRARMIAGLVPAGTAASGPTAAWIHGAGDTPPTPHHVHRAVERRFRPDPDHRLIFHDTRVPASDVQLLGGVLTTTPVRTMVDLALTTTRDPRMLVWMRLLAAESPPLVEEAERSLSARTRVPGSRGALATLERLRLRRR
jgi:hypothetical protein